MERHSKESGYDLVLDVRRLILLFALLIVVCGGFFLLGFIEGKRQVVQTSFREPATASAPTVLPEPPRTDASRAAEAPAKTLEDATRTQLNWYETVSDTAKSRATEKNTPAAPAPTVRPAGSKPQAPALAPKPSAGVTYSCQVGAFSQRKEAEAKLSTVKRLGHIAFIEATQSKKGYFLLKVGRFKTRAEAAEMQLRLKKDGIASFIKTN
ncbi:MAG: SPOR domain-containing protein [Acidobacteria bacterium]|nr:SPOR domain-containing protein [Acidobacteriota bacterium]